MVFPFVYIMLFTFLGVVSRYVIHFKMLKIPLLWCVFNYLQFCAFPVQLCSCMCFIGSYDSHSLVLCGLFDLTFYYLGLWGALNLIILSKLLPILISCCNLSLCLWLLLYSLHLYDYILCNVLRLCCHCWLSC